MAGVETFTDLCDRLLQPFQTDDAICLDPLRVKIKIAIDGSSEQAEAANIIDCVYNSSYRRAGGEVIRIGRDRFDGLPETVTLVGVHEVAGISPVMVTMRVVSGDDLEIFDFFQPSESGTWPHQREGRYRKPGEMGRLSFHPFLDVLRDNTTCVVEQGKIDHYKKEIFRMIYCAGLEILRSNGVEMLYFMVGKHVNIFLRNCGLYATTVSGIELKQTPEIDEIRQEFRHYWCPDKPPRHQPKVYLGPWELEGK